MNSKMSWKLSLIITFCLILASFAMAQDGVISFESDSPSYQVGQQFDVRIILNTGTHSVGVVQIRANFDDTLLSIVPGDITPNTTAWPDPSPEPVSVTGNLIKFVVGKFGGNSGASVLVGTLKFTALAQGTANITFVGGSDANNSTMALDSSTFTNILGVLNDISIGVTASAPRWDFDVDEEGWAFSGQIDTLDPPTESVSGGCLNMQATNNTNTFGFWYSPSDAIPELMPDSIYRARFGVKSDQAVKSDVPSFRVRWNASNFKQGEYIMVNSNDAGDASPDTTVVDYDLYFSPQGDALLPAVTGILSIDMVNINPNDSATAMICLDYAQVDRINIADAGSSTSVQAYTFAADEEGWTSTPQIGTFDLPIFAWDAEGFLSMQCDSSNNTFGFWQNAQDDITLDNGVLYQLRVKAGTDAALTKILQEDPPMIRIRMYDHPSNQMCSVMQVPVMSKYTVPTITKLAQPVIFSDFYAYFHNSLGIGPSLGIAVDIVNVDPAMSPTGIIAVTEVELSSFTIPTF